MNQVKEQFIWRRNMSIENITITSDSEIGYHVYIYYTDYKTMINSCLYKWVDDIKDAIFLIDSIKGGNNND
jgi:hypothetical protein